MFNKKKNVNKSEIDEEKRKRRKIMLMILFVLFLISSLGLTTYAWFSSNKRTTIEGIDIRVATIDGMQISADAINWGNDLTRDQIINAYKTYPRAENQLPDVFNTVSTVGNVTDGKMDMFWGITTDEKDGVFTLTTTREKEIQCTGDEECGSKVYTAFDVFLLVNRPAVIALSANSNVMPRNENYTKGAQYAARVGFVNEGTVSTDANPASAQALRGGSRAYIWEPNYDKHTEDGVRAAKSIYGLDTTRTGAARLQYRGVNNEFQTPISIDQTDKSSYFSLVNPAIATVEGFSEDQVFLNIPSGITKLRIYLWLEGQDVDMTDAIAADSLTFNIEFRMVN